MIDGWKTRKEALARHDANNALFGAQGHRWQSRPVALADVEAFEARHGVRLPAAYRAWITEVGAGAGPFYGFVDLADNDAAGVGRPFPHDEEYLDEQGLPEGVDARDGTLVLTDHGCGYEDLLVLSGPRAGEVWIDLRSAEGPLRPWYETFEAYMEAWLRRTEVEWAIDTIGAWQPFAPETGFLAQARASMDALLYGGRDPMCGEYPLPADGLFITLARLHMADGDLDQAQAAFAQAADFAYSREGTAALGDCALAVHRGDPQARLDAARAGLGAEGVGWDVRIRLHREAIAALDALGRDDEALQQRIALADADDDNVDAQLDVVQVLLARDQIAEAADFLRAVAEGGGDDWDDDEAGGDDEAAATAERLAALLDQLRRRLVAAGREAQADALARQLGVA